MRHAARAPPPQRFEDRRFWCVRLLQLLAFCNFVVEFSEGSCQFLIVCFGCAVVGDLQNYVPKQCQIIAKLVTSRDSFLLRTYTNNFSFHRMFQRVRAASWLFPFLACTNNYQKIIVCFEGCAVLRGCSLLKHT